jgi:hypothetical protein
VFRNQLCRPGRGNVDDGASGGHAEKKAGGSKKWKNESSRIECVGGFAAKFRSVLGVDVRWPLSKSGVDKSSRMGDKGTKRANSGVGRVEEERW